MANQSHGPYVIQFGHKAKFYKAAQTSNELGSWLDSAVDATEYQVKADAQHAISTLRVNRHDRMQCRVVPMHAIAREKRTAALNFGESRT